MKSNRWTIFRAAGWVWPALVGMMLSACDGPRRNADPDDGDGPAAATTFARSFGNARTDNVVALESDLSGDLWVLGNFRSEPISNLSTDLEERPWLSRLDASGNPVWEVSPQSAAGKSTVVWQFGQATPDGGGLFVGNLESREGKNVLLQMQDGDGDVAWELQLDGTSHWEQNGMTFVPSRPASDETLTAVHGRPDYGWWVIVDSQAVGFNAGKDAAFGAPIVLIWFISPDGQVSAGSPTFFGSIDINRSAEEENAEDAVGTFHAASTSFPGGPVRTPDATLGILVRSISSARDIDQVALVTVFRRADGSIRPIAGEVRPPDDVEDKFALSPELVLHFDTYLGSFLEPGKFLNLRGPEFGRGFDDYRLSMFAIGTGVDWTTSISRPLGTEINAVASTSWLAPDPVSGSPVAYSQIWLGGREWRDGQYVPLLWKISNDGELEGECALNPLVSGYQGVTVAALSAVTRENRLRVIMQTGPGSSATGVEALLEVTVDRDCQVIAGETRVYRAGSLSAETALSFFSSRPEYTLRENPADPGGAMLETLAIHQYRKIFRFDQATGTELSTVPNSDFGTRGALPVDMAVVKTGSALVEPQVVLTGAAGQLQAFDASGQPLYHVSIPAANGAPLRDPVIDDQGNLWVIGSDSLMQLDNSLGAASVRFARCSGLPVDARPADNFCRQPEILAIDDGSIATNRLHVIGRTAIPDGGQEPPGYGYFRATLDTGQTGVASMRYLPAEFGDLVFLNNETRDQELSLTADSINGGADDVMLINAYQRAPQLFLQDIAAGRTRFSRQLYHYGTTAGTRWAMDTTELSVRDARLAHDGGVVILMVASGSDRLLSKQAAELSGFDRNIGVMKLTAEGNVQWFRIYGTAAEDLPVSLTRTANGYAVTSVSRGVDAVTPGSQDLFILKLGVDGHIAADEEGTEFCQAGIADLSGSAAYDRLLTDIGGMLARPLLPLAGGDVSWTTTSLETNTLAVERAEFMSTNTARQCIGAATNVQEDPFTAQRNGSVSVAVSGNGTVTIQSAAIADINCVDNCSTPVAVGAQVTLTALADDQWQFDAWSGDAVCIDGSTGNSTLVSATEAGVNCTATFLPVNRAPVAAFDVDPPVGITTGDEVRFDASASTDPDGSIATYEWDFDNDGVVDSPNVTATFTYRAAGTYTVQLTVTDFDGLSATLSRSLIVTNALSEPPSASFFVAPAGQTTLGTPLTFDASGSTDDIGIVSWEWDLGDDGGVDATGQVVTLTPPVVGQTPIRLRVVDADGQFDEATGTVDVIAGGGATYSLRVVLNGPGGVDVTPLGVSLPNSTSCDGNECFIFSIPSGLQLTLSPFGFTPAVFQGWSPTECDAIENDLCRLTMTGDRSVTALFQ